MWFYVLKRIAAAILTLFVVITLTFFLMFLIPGGPFESEKSVSPSTLAALEARYGLDQPVAVQYRNYLAGLLRGDLGPSLKQRGRMVSEIIAQGFPASARIGGAAVSAAVCAGILLGTVSARFRDRWPDRLISAAAAAGISAPGFVLTTVLMVVFGVKLRLLPTMGLSSPAHYILPVLSLAVYPASYLCRLIRASLLETLEQEYLRTAAANGLSPARILFRHALRNALLPAIAYLGPLLAYTLTGSFVVEKILTIPGLGSELIRAISSRDYPLIMGTTIFLASLMVLMNLLSDLLSRLVDPRIRLK